MTLHAIRIAAYGGPEVMRWEAIAAPAPAAGEVVVAVRACGVNPVDWKTREGMRKGRGSFALPATLGCDLSGVVAEVGEGAGDLRPGQEVFGMTGLHGAFADRVALPASHLAPKPAGLDHIHAAAVPLAALTAWQALHIAGIAPGMRVLVHAGSGGVGGFAVQIARSLGAEVVATTSAANADYVRQLGAVQVIDYQGERFENAAAPVDIVLDLLGGETQARSWTLLKPGGFLVSTIGIVDGARRPEGARAARVGVTANGEQLAAIAALIERGEIRVEVATTLPLAEAAAALELSRAGRTRGKIVLRLD